MLVLDASSNNKEPNWNLLKKAGVSAVWLKASEGMNWRDPNFAAWRKAANKAGLKVGAYHFARPDLHPFDRIGEALNFWRAVGKVNTTDLRPVLDYEVLSSHGGDEAWIRAFNQSVKARLGVGPLFYSYPALVAKLKLTKPVGYGLWLASYGRNDGVEHAYTVPAPWKKVVAHQFSSKCRVIGCSGVVDLSKVFSPNAVLAHPVKAKVDYYIDSAVSRL
jgi:lysozyme